MDALISTAHVTVSDHIRMDALRAVEHGEQHSRSIVTTHLDGMISMSSSVTNVVT